MPSMHPMEIRDRYLNDTHFHALTNQFLSFMEINGIQPYEVKDAAFMAELIYRERHAVPIYQIFEKDI